MANRIKVTPRAREKFLKQLREHANVTWAARACATTTRPWYALRQRGLAEDADPKDRAFVEEWDAAVNEALETAAGEAWRRGVQGINRPLTYQGEIMRDVVLDTNGEPVLDATGNPVTRARTVKEYSDRMLEFWLKSKDPRVFGDKTKAEISGPDGAPITTKIEVVFVKGGRK